MIRSTRCACPRELWEIVAEEYGEGKAFDFMKVMNEKAPLTVRVNLLKTTRDEVSISSFLLNVLNFIILAFQYLEKEIRSQSQKD